MRALWKNTHIRTTESVDHLACWDCTMEANSDGIMWHLDKGQSKNEKQTLERDNVTLSCLWVLSLCLIIVGNASCVNYTYSSHIVYQIFISISFELHIFQKLLVKMLWIKFKHCGTFILVWGMCWCVLVPMSVDIQAKATFIMCISLCFCFPQNMTEDQMHKSSRFGSPRLL